MSSGWAVGRAVRGRKIIMGERSLGSKRLERRPAAILAADVATSIRLLGADAIELRREMALRKDDVPERARDLGSYW